MTEEEFNKKIENISDIYSFILLLYIYLDNEGKNIIQGRYNKDIKENNVSESLKSIKKLVQDLVIYNTNEFNLWKKVWQKELRKFPSNITTCLYHTLLRLDNVLAEYIDFSQKIKYEKGPVKKIEQYNFYYKKPESFFEDQMRKNGIRRGRQTTEYNVNNINHDFKTFEIIKDSDLHGYTPRIIGYNPKNCFGKEIKFSISSLDNEKWFCINLDHEKHQFTIEYNNLAINDHNLKMRNLINRADELLSDIIIFPELAMNNETEPKILDYFYNNQVNNLKLCFMGSKWSNNKNECLLLTSGGTRLVRQTKKNPYSFFHKSMNTYYYENIDTSDKVITFVDIKGIGRLVYFICADFNDESIKAICSIMHADFIFVSAYTNNTNLMYLTAENFSSLNTISTLLSNSCSAIDDISKNTYCSFIEVPEIGEKIKCKNLHHAYPCLNSKKNKCDNCLQSVILK